MINLFRDIYNYFLLKKEKNKIGFFCENENIFEYLKPYIINKSKKKKITLISFTKINFNLNNVKLFFFKTKFFRELVFLTLNLKFLYSSTPGLGKSLFKKSITSKCKYIYLQHSLASMTMVYENDAFDNFDALQAVTNYQFNEFNEIKEFKNLKFKIFKSNYLFLKSKLITSNKKYQKDVLIAPSWNTNFYHLNCHKILSNLLNEKNISYDLRPHPMSFIKKEISIYELQKLNISYNIDYNLNFFNYTFFVSDWSGIFIEYAVIIKKKPFLINTPKKILNKFFEKYSNKPAEIFLRKKIAKNFEVKDIDKLVNELLIDLKQKEFNNINSKNFKLLYENNNFYFNL